MSNLFLQSEQPGNLHHGGCIRAAARRYNIPLEGWLDLSTGINPNGWRVTEIPSSAWARLPEDDDGLVTVACHYYDAESLLPVAGSQAAILALPQLRQPSRVSVLHPGYAEHAYAWKRNHHKVTAVTSVQINDVLAETDVLIITHPNNPTGDVFSAEELLTWHEQLADRGGWLIVDEAYMDTTPECSIISYTNSAGLIVLRSLGKFFGLAGTRVGFVCAHTTLLEQLKTFLGPWTISAPARWIAAQALQDISWQKVTRKQLAWDKLRLQRLLTQYHLIPDGGCSLFQWVCTPHAFALHEMLVAQGILTRYFSDPQSVRFGLPGEKEDWNRLDGALYKFSTYITGGADK